MRSRTMRSCVLVGTMVVAAAVMHAQTNRRGSTLLGVGTSTPVTSPSDPNAAAAFFDDTVLHEVRLEINTKDWQSLKDNFLSNTYYPVDFRWRGEVVRNVGIRSRGTSTRSGTKPGLRVDFNRYSSQQTFRGLKSFILRNNLTDGTGMHERISMLFFRQMGEPASREAHTRLYINGAYAGLYTIVESLDKDYLADRFGEGEQEGYLYEYDRNPGDEPYYLQDLGRSPDLYVPHPFKPETHESDPRPERIADMIHTIAEASPASFRSAIAGFIDVNQFLRHIAIEVFLGDTDGFLGNFGVNNFYLYRPRNDAAHILIPWDKSESMHDGPHHPLLHTLDDVPDANRNRLMARLLAWPDLRNFYFDTLIQCAVAAAEPAPGDGRGWMSREIERELSQIRNSALEDPDTPFTDDEFNAAVSDLQTFALERSDFVVAEVERLRGVEPYWAVP